MPTTVPGQLLAAIKARRFTAIGKLFANPVDFQAWTPTGHWVAADATTVARIVEVWFSPGSGSQVVFSNEISGARGAASLELEITWKTPPDDQQRVLRQVYLLTVKGERIASARVYCAGLHTEFPEVDLEKQRRSKGIVAAKPAAPKAITAKAS
ncbi:MAG TPA: hypothetical protein VEZ14_14920 [Dehalococcoidia bacterium]|nr:hypothetical protein [Dehalococcoidia bacterium]